MKRTMKTFTVFARLNIECTLSIKAESLEDVIAQARTLKELDFINLKGDFLDGSMKIEGAMEENNG